MKYATLVLFLTLSGAATPALADHREQGSSHDHTAHSAPAAAKPAVSPAFAALDKDKNGFLSKAEMAKHPMAAHFGMMDANKDGKLSPREFSSMGAPRHAHELIPVNAWALDGPNIPKQ